MAGDFSRGLLSPPWHTTYLTVTTLSLGLLVGMWYGPSQFRHHLELVTPGIVVGMFTLTALLHWYDAAERPFIRGG